MVFETKEEALDALEATRQDWLSAARAVARTIGKEGRAITVNDVRALAPKLPDDVDPRVYGAIFNTPEWEFVAYVKSARKVSHARPVAQFRFIG